MSVLTSAADHFHCLGLGRTKSYQIKLRGRFLIDTFHFFFRLIDSKFRVPMLYRKLLAQAHCATAGHRYFNKNLNHHVHGHVLQGAGSR